MSREPKVYKNSPTPQPWIKPCLLFIFFDGESYTLTP